MRTTAARTAPLAPHFVRCRYVSGGLRIRNEVVQVRPASELYQQACRANRRLQLKKEIAQLEHERDLFMLETEQARAPRPRRPRTPPGQTMAATISYRVERAGTFRASAGRERCCTRPAHSSRACVWFSSGTRSSSRRKR